MRAIILALTCAFLETVVAKNSPLLYIVSQQRVWNIGETVEFDCIATDAHKSQVFWDKINGEKPHKQEILSRGDELLTKDNKFAIDHDPYTDRYILQINDIQETHAGFYQCRIQLSVNDSISQKVELKVRKPPVIRDNSTESLVIVTAGGPVILKCYASGAILATGRPIMIGGNKVTITAIQETDRGTYYCVNNDAGRRAKHNINVEVESAS